MSGELIQRRYRVAECAVGDVVDDQMFDRNGAAWMDTVTCSVVVAGERERSLFHKVAVTCVINENNDTYYETMWQRVK